MATLLVWGFLAELFGTSAQETESRDRVRMEGTGTLSKHFPSLDRMFEEARNIPESVIWAGRVSLERASCA